MMQSDKYHMRTNRAWLDKVKKFVDKHDFGSIANLIRISVNKFMKEYK